MQQLMVINNFYFQVNKIHFFFKSLNIGIRDSRHTKHTCTHYACLTIIMKKTLTVWKGF